MSLAEFSAHLGLIGGINIRVGQIDKLIRVESHSPHRINDYPVAGKNSIAAHVNISNGVAFDEYPAAGAPNALKFDT